MNNRNDAKRSSSKAQHLLVDTPALAPPQNNNDHEPPLTVESMRALGHAQAMEWLDDVSDLRTNAPLLRWRDGCRDEIHEILPTLIDLDFQQKTDLLNAWTEAFDAEIGDELAALRGTVGDARDNIDVAVIVVRDLLQVAKSAVLASSIPHTRAESAIHAAGRYLDDIAASVAFIDGWTMASGGGK